MCLCMYMCRITKSFFLAKLIFLIINKQITWDVSRNKTKLSCKLNYPKLYSEFYVNLYPAVFGITLNWRLEMHISELLETRCVLKATVYYVIMSMFIKIYSSRGERPVPKFFYMSYFNVVHVFYLMRDYDIFYCVIILKAINLLL